MTLCSLKNRPPPSWRRLASTIVLGEYYKLDGQIPLQMRSFGNAQDRKRWNRKSFRDDGDGLAIRYGNQDPVILDRPSHGTHRGRRRETDPETHCAVTWTDRIMTGLSWNQIERLAPYKEEWRAFVGGLCPGNG